MKKQLNLIWSVVLILFVSTMAFSQSVTGKVVDNNGEPIIGVSVVIKGTTMGTITDTDGMYSIGTEPDNVLVFSYLGYRVEERTPDSASEVIMYEDARKLSDVVVTATRQPIRRIESTTAIDVINNQIISSMKPEGFSEAIQGTPGMYTSQSQGRFRGAIFTRGFPDGSGNGLVYTGILLDGLPSLATTARPPDFAFGMDLNVEKIEVVRGSAATLFGRASAAGVVNVISKVGGTETKGTVNVTRYNNNVTDGVNADGERGGIDYKVDANINGPISENLRYNIGGYYVNDKGFRDLGYNDRGGQMRFNLDYLGDKLNARVFGSYVNVSIQNMIDIPYKLSDNTPADGWDIYDSFYTPTLDTLAYTVVDREGNFLPRTGRATNEDGNYARGYNVGFHLDYELTDALTLSNKFRYQSYDHGTKFNLGVSTGYVAAPFSQIRILIDGDGNDTDYMNELRLGYKLTTGSLNHNFSLGSYISNGNYTPTTWSLAGWALPVADNRGLNLFAPFGGQARLDEYTIKATSFFLGDEIATTNDKLRLNVGVRYDKIDMDLQGFYSVVENLQREEEHSDVSFSVGANYSLNERSAVYANFVNAFRMPDYTAYTPADSLSFDPNDIEGGDNPRIQDNEKITNIEVGYRTGFGDLGVDVAGFYTNIKNRLATVYEGAVAVSRPLGTNTINGIELGLTYAPASLQGLLIRASATYQKAKFDNFKIPLGNADPNGELYGNTLINEGTDAAGATVFSLDLNGNQLPRVPSTIFNLSANYRMKYLDLTAQMNHFANRFADATNVLKQADITNLNIGATIKYPLKNGSNIRLGVLAKNIINTDKALRFLYVSDNDQGIALQQRIDSGDIDPETTYYTGIPFLPRRILITLGYDF